MGLRAQVLCSPLIQSHNSITDHLLIYVAMLNRRVPFDAAEPLTLPTSGRHTAQGTDSLGRRGACAYCFPLLAFANAPHSTCTLFSIGNN